jgi:GNAT superfamily N-acetyltransferase
MTVSVRKATRGDAALIVDFIRKLARYEKLENEAVLSVSDIEERLFCADPKAFCLIADVGDDPVGFALYFYNFSTFLGRHGIYLEDLFVEESARGKGAGKALLASLAKITSEENLGRLEWSVLDWNAPSIAFYKSLGAVPMDEWTVFRLTGDGLRKLAASQAVNE